MNNKLVLLLIVMLSLFAVAGCGSETTPPSPPSAPAGEDCNCSPADVFFPYQPVAVFDEVKLKEPSGIVYHPQLESLFVIGDKADLSQLTPDGFKVRQEKLIKGANLEGITLNPSTGMLYVAYEGHDRIIEVDPNTFAVTREMAVDRLFEGKQLIKAGGGGLEGIAFVPGATPDDAGSFYLTNQSYRLSGDDPSLILEVVIDDSGAEPVARIVRSFSVGVTDLSGIFYRPGTEQLMVVSDVNNLLLHITRDGEVVQAYALPGQDQEGIAFDDKGFLYISEDSGNSGKVIKYQPAGSN